MAASDAGYAQRILAVATSNRSADLSLEQCVLAAMPYERYLKTVHWQSLAATCKRLADNRCQVCNQLAPLHAHHRTYERRGFEKPTDVIALCEACHTLYHSAGKLKQKETRGLDEWNNRA